ncbi:unnamed protein product [Spirodela intermedia]|uniref:ATP synthase subunit O, mitochondrial n=1 Tax=Spirodela intermedia TaxID=51605 RepID=A0ABN7ED33_SPIIN|nr:unnamed protein product [Spirodela intermedia]
MAMAGRMRSGFSIFHKTLKAESAVEHGRIGSPSNIVSQHLRNYATGKSSKEESIKVPLSLFGVSGNYASALFIASSKANSWISFKREPCISQFIKDLSVRADVRVKAVQEIFSEAGFTDVTKNFLAIMAEKGRLRHLEKIAKTFSDLTMAHKGEVKVTVTTVIPLPAEEEKQLKETLQDIIGQGRLILGGLVCGVGQKVFDMSIKTRAKQMERFLREPVNFESF